MEVKRRRPLGSVCAALDAIGLAALAVGLLGSPPLALGAVALGGALLALGLLRRPQRVLADEHGRLSLFPALGASVTFARRSLEVRVDPGTSAARVALESSLVGGALGCLRAWAGCDDALKVILVFAALYLRLAAWRCAPSLALSGRDVAGRHRSAWLDPRDFDDPAALESVLLARQLARLPRRSPQPA